MSSLPLALSILAFIAFDLILVWAIIAAFVRTGWNSIADRFPARPPAPDAVSRRFQSVAIGVANYGMCVHISVDDTALHLHPALFLRLFGARGISVPWENVVFKRRQKILGTKYVRITVGATTLTGPDWAFGLSEDSTR